MSCVNIKALAKRECDWIIIKSRIGRGVVDGNGGMRQPCHEFLDVTDALDTSDGRPKRRIIPEK